MEVDHDVSHLVQGRLSHYEWVSMIVLSCCIWILLPLTVTLSPLTVVLIPVISTIILLLLLILHDLDRLKWSEGVWIWMPLARLFQSIGLDPYIPKPVLDRLSNTDFLLQMDSYRLATYPDEYPNHIKTKKVKKIVVKK